MAIKVISFSIWGNNKTYCIGLVRNVILAKYLFKEWKVWVYYNQTVPKCIIEWLSKQDNVKLIKIEDRNTTNGYRQNGQQGSIWRYYPLEDEDVDVVVCRDTDSRLSYYEVVQIKRWLDEGKCDILSMIDGYERTNGRVVRAGTCAFKSKGKKIDIQKAMKDVFYNKQKLPFYCDETFLHHIIKRYYDLNLIRFVPRGVKDPIEKVAGCDLFTVFVGDVLDENNVVLNKYTNHVWSKRNLKDDDDGEILKYIEHDDRKIQNFIKMVKL
jgi:hypothetical protein